MLTFIRRAETKVLKRPDNHRKSVVMSCIEEPSLVINFESWPNGGTHDAFDRLVAKGFRITVHENGE